MGRNNGEMAIVSIERDCRVKVISRAVGFKQRSFCLRLGRRFDLSRIWVYYAMFLGKAS